VKTTATSEQYRAAFEDEAKRSYPAVDDIERRMGWALARDRLEWMAAVLACPVKRNPPNWQHGRVLYALARKYLETHRSVTMLDVGTAKGFSACVLGWAIIDAGRTGLVQSVDMIEPESREIRNTVAEVDGLKTLHEIVRPFMPQGVAFTWHGGGSLKLLYSMIDADERIGFAFVDGKHSRGTVMMEADCLAKLQSAGDMVLFDDMQIPEVNAGVRGIDPRRYRVEEFRVSPERGYALATRL
jgi:predicted O-methyltransferase YrrM